MEEAMVEEMGSPEDDGRVPILIREGYSGRGPHLRRVRRKSKKCGICPLDEEESDFFFRLGQSLDGYCRSMQGPPQSVSLELSAGPQKLLSSKDTEPGESGRSWIDCTQEAELECMLFPKNAAQPGSLDHLFGFQGLFGDESLSLLTQDPPQSPALYPGVLTEDSTEQQETQPTSVVGISGTPPDLEGPEVKALPVSGLGLGQGLAAPAEPLDRLSGTSREQRRPKHVRKRPTMGPVSCAQKPRTDGSSWNLTERGCPGVEAMRVPCGVKLVYYVCSGPVIQLLGAFNNCQPGGQLETLEDLKCDLPEMENEEPLQPGTEDPGEQETMPLDVGVRATVVRTMQEMLWTRVQEFPDLLLREEEVAGIAEGIEAALFHLTQDTNLRYKTKYRSLLFNLRDPRNSDLFLKVAHCDVSPHDLVQMSSIQLAPKELSRWRDQEERRVHVLIMEPTFLGVVVQESYLPVPLEKERQASSSSDTDDNNGSQLGITGLDIIEQQQKELCRLPTSKLTHKGEVEIPRDSDQMLTLEDLTESTMPREYSPQALTTPLEDTTDQHQHQFSDSNCHNCKGGKEGRKGINSSCLEPHVGVSHSMDWECSAKLPDSSRAIMNKEENAIRNAPSPAPVSSPEMLKAGETSSKEPQNRLQIPAEPKDVPPSPPPWEGSIDMFSIKPFLAKAQLISGHSCQLLQALPEVIRSAGCLSPNDLWDLLDSMCPAKAKDICVARLCPHGSRDIHNYRLLYSYLNNKQRHCLATVRHAKMVLLPLPAFKPLPARLRPLGGPGLETTHPSLLLAVLLPKDGLPDIAMSSPLWNKVPKTVSFSKRVEKRCYQPEDSISEATLRGSPSHKKAPKQSLAKGSLAPRNVCAWQSLPRGRGRQQPRWEQQSPEASWCHPQHPNSDRPVFPGIGHGQHLHRASCFHQDILQHLNILVTMSHQFQASLWPPGQEPLLPSSAVFAVPDPHGPIPDPSVGPVDRDGSGCPWPKRPDPLNPSE